MVEQPTQNLTIELARDQVRRIQRAVEAGGYASQSDVIREAIRLWEMREDARHSDIAELRRAYDEGMASGEGRAVQPSRFLSELKADAQKRG